MGTVCGSVGNAEILYLNAPAVQCMQLVCALSGTECPETEFLSDGIIFPESEIFRYDGVHQISGIESVCIGMSADGVCIPEKYSHGRGRILVIHDDSGVGGGRLDGDFLYPVLCESFGHAVSVFRRPVTAGSEVNPDFVESAEASARKISLDSADGRFSAVYRHDADVVPTNPHTGIFSGKNISGGESMIYYTADLHLNHKNILHMCRRPFDNLQEMHRTIKQYWNAAVQDNDEVYIIGDVCMSFNGETADYLRSLHGKKHLIIGNHDKKHLKTEKFRELFETIDHYLTIGDEGRKVVLFHYPILEWDGYFKGWYHIYGHIHNNDANFANQLLKQEPFRNAFNAGMDLNDFTPRTLSQMITVRNMI